MTINGTPTNLESITFMEYIKQHNLNVALIALELNGRIIPKEEFATIMFKQGDVIEIVSFVGGG